MKTEFENSVKRLKSTGYQNCLDKSLFVGRTVKFQTGCFFMKNANHYELELSILRKNE